MYKKNRDVPAAQNANFPAFRIAFMASPMMMRDVIEPKDILSIFTSDLDTAKFKAEVTPNSSYELEITTSQKHERKSNCSFSFCKKKSTSSLFDEKKRYNLKNSKNSFSFAFLLKQASLINI